MLILLYIHICQLFSLIKSVSRTFILFFQLSKPPMGNKHSEPPQAASGSNEGRLAVTSSNKADDVDEPVIDGM